ncbi:helix-turn-helix domain-containing protein [Ramlibacter sp. MAHUQ-53]|uniref:helix-turn-helix domain-containing protein n=1 Tax=unclassified Ramlibacter TaxID=2617605 RepID=UPI003640FFAB
MTMQDRLIELLRASWLTPLEALQQAGCLSLSQRCGEFRRRGLPVVDRWVDLPNGKRVKAYHIAEAEAA